MREFFRPYALNKYEGIVLLACAILIFYQYTPLLWAGFPIEQESAVFLQAVSSVGWWEALGTSNYQPIFPFLNFILKLETILISHLGQPIFFLLLLLFHLGNAGLLLVVTRNQFRKWDVQTAPLWPQLGRERLAGISAALLFSSFNAYYLIVSSPLCSAIGFSILFLVGHFYILALDCVDSPAKKRAQTIALGSIAILMPFFWAYSLLFFAALFLLWPQAKIRRKSLVVFAVLHLAGTLVQMKILDPRFGGADGGMLGIIVESPSLYLFGVLQNLYAGISFGLLFQNFLQFGAPYSMDFFVGGFGLLLFVLGVLLPKRDEGYRFALRGSAVLTVISLLNIFLLRNPLSRDEGRLYDALFAASQPRYYYLPSAFFAVTFACAIFSLIGFLPQRFRKKALGASLGFLFLFSLANAKATRNKVEFAAQNMRIEIWNYVPYRLLRPPEANPEDPSFLKGYSGVIR